MAGAADKEREDGTIRWVQGESWDFLLPGHGNVIHRLELDDVPARHPGAFENTQRRMGHRQKVAELLRVDQRPRTHLVIG